MRAIRTKHLKYIPASHEYPKSPGVLKKILLKKENLLNGKAEMTIGDEKEQIEKGGKTVTVS